MLAHKHSVAVYHWCGKLGRVFHFDVDKNSVQARPTHNAFTYGYGYLPCSKMQSSVTISVDSISLIKFSSHQEPYYFQMTVPIEEHKSYEFNKMIVWDTESLVCGRVEERS